MGKGQNVENHFVESQKKNIESQKRTSKIRTSKVSIKRIRTSKDQNDDNYYGIVPMDTKACGGLD